MSEFNAKQIAYIPTMLWAATIKQTFGNISYGRIYKIFNRKKDKTDAEWWQEHSGRLYKNSRGKTKVRSRTFIDKIEQYVPGSKHLLLNPLWKIILNPDASLEQIHNYMRALPVNIQNRLFRITTGESREVRKTIKYATVLYISKMNTLDALACLLMMIKEAEIQGQFEASLDCKWRAHQLLCRLATFEPLKLHIPFLYEYIFVNFLSENKALSDRFKILINLLPDYFRCPSRYPIPEYIEHNLDLLALAIKHKLITNSEQDQLKLLFWIDIEFKRTEIFQALLILEQPEPSHSESEKSLLTRLTQRLQKKGNGSIFHGHYWIN